MDGAMKPRPTLADFAASAAGGNPWACRICQCCDWKVRDSRQFGVGPRKRERVCRNCGEPMQTYEVPVPPGHKLTIVPVDDEEEAA